MEEARVTNEMCYNGCFVCLASTWGFVKMILCCRCRSLARLICPERPLEDLDSSADSSDWTLPEMESHPGTPTPSPTLHSPREPRVRFRSVVDTVRLFVLPAGTRRHSMEWTQESTVESINEES